jgi:hypothetical protein
MRRHFRAWLRDRYEGDVAKLRGAWADPAVSFDTAEVPSAEKQFSTSLFLFRDPKKERSVIDYFECFAELADDDLIEFCRFVKEETRRILAGGELSTYQRSGHLGLHRVLKSPHIDFIVSPYSYGFRGIGGDGLPMQPGESLRVNGKIYLMEEDTRMHPAKNTMAVYRRNFAQIVTHGLGVTWMHDSGMDDFPENRQEWWPLLARTQRIGTWALDLDRTPASEVAVFLDPESFFYQTLKNSLDLPLIFQQKLVSLNRFGAPRDVDLLDDLLDGGLPDYKLYMFLNPWHLDRTRREKLAKVVKRVGKDTDAFTVTLKPASTELYFTGAESVLRSLGS